MKTLYTQPGRFRIGYVLKFVLGALILLFFGFCFLIEIYWGIWSFIGPLLGLALMMNGMTGSKIKQVYLNVDNRTLDIEKVSLFRKKIKAIPLSRLRVDLRLDEGKKGTSGQKLKLLFYDADHEIAELKSDYKTNKKVEQLYYTLKEVTQRL